MKRPFSFSLRAILLLVALLAGWLAIQVHVAQIHRTVAERVRELGGDIRYEHEDNSYSSSDEESKLTAILRQRLGGGYGDDVNMVAVHGESVTDEDVRLFARLTSYRWLSFYDTSVTDEGLSHINDMVDLVWLGLDGSQVTDNGLEHLPPNLKNLTLANRPITDAGVDVIVRR